MNEEKPKTFKLQKTVSTRQHGWTALISLILGILFYSSVIGVILLAVGIISGIIWAIRISREPKKQKPKTEIVKEKLIEKSSKKSDLLQFIKDNMKTIIYLVAFIILVVIGLLIYQTTQENSRMQDDLQSEIHDQNCLIKQGNGETDYSCRNTYYGGTDRYYGPR